MTQDRRITDKLPGHPLQWDDSASPSATPAAGQAGLANMVRTEPEVVQSFALEDGRCVMGDPDLGALKDGTYWICKAPVYRAAPVAADTEQAIPEGYALVPLDAPLEMAKAFRDADKKHDRFLDGYAAMLAAAPKPPLATPADAGAGLTQADLWKGFVERAISVLQRHIVPEGLSDRAALLELYEIFDGPEFHAMGETAQMDCDLRQAREMAISRQAESLARMSTPGAPVTASDGSSAHLIEAGALRQYQHNDGSDLVFAYDKAIVDREFARLTAPPVIHVAHTYTNSDGAAVIHSLNVHSTIRHDGGSYSVFVDLPPAPVTAEPAQSDLLNEVADVLAAQNWRGDLQERLREAATHSAPADRDAIRDQALEEAARVVLDGNYWNGAPSHEYSSAENRAAAIRALKSMERAADAKGGQQ